MHHPHRHSARRRLMLMAALAVGAGKPTYAPAQEAYPNKPIRMTVPFPPGGSADLAARMLAEGLRTELGVAIVVENRPGASGVLGSQTVLRAPADGHQLLFGTLNSQICAPLLMAKPPYDGVKDFTPLGLVMSVPGVVLASATLPVSSFAEFVRYAKQRPGRLSYGSAGIGSNNHLVVEMLKARTGIDMVHVPFRGVSDGHQALTAGDVALLIDSPLSARPWLQQGKVRALAVTSARRSPVLPDVPTLLELGVLDRAAPFWLGLFAASGLPPAIAARLREATSRALATPEMVEFAGKGGAELGAIGVQKFAEQLQDEQRLWGDLIKTHRFQTD